MKDVNNYDVMEQVFGDGFESQNEVALQKMVQVNSRFIHYWILHHVVHIYYAGDLFKQRWVLLLGPSKHLKLVSISSAKLQQPKLNAKASPII